MKIEFWGATDEVTGSMTFLHFESGTVMIDCGLAQGNDDVKALNLLSLPVDPKNIKAVVISHAHLDHSGYLPRLVKKGFNGPIYCSPATSKLMRIILTDSAKLNEEEFYDQADVTKAMNMVRIRDWKKSFEEQGAEFTLFPVGHILGASGVQIRYQGKTLVFSGDLGRMNDPVLPEYEHSPKADLVVMESTYGGKKRDGNIEAELETFLTTVAKENRVGIIASFAVARAQMLLTLISEFYERHPEKKVRVCIDGPMMAEANKVYRNYSYLTKHPGSVFFALEKFDLIEYQREWESLRKKSGPLIIVSSSGMLTGGRIHRHLYNWRNDEKAILFLPGYQSRGTPGRAMKEGSRQLIGPDDEVFTWQGEVWGSESFSSHADQEELLNWVSENKNAQVFLLHGETSSKIALRSELLNRGHRSVEIPERGSIIEI